MMSKFLIFFFFLVLYLNLILITLGKFMIKSKKEILTTHNLDDVYQTNLQHEMVITIFKMSINKHS